MFGVQVIGLESWTTEKLNEMRRMAATEAALRARENGAVLRRPWYQEAAFRAGNALASLGAWLQRVGGYRAQTG